MSDILNGLPLVGLISESCEKLLGQRADKRSMEKLVLGYMREAFCYSKKCARGRLPDDEIFSLAYKALNAAARRFDSAKGRFFVFAKIYLRWEIKHAWGDKSVVRNSTSPDDHFPSENTEEYMEQMGDWDCAMTPPELLREEFDFDKVEFNERMGMIEPHLRALNKNERMVIKLRFHTGWDFARIGVKIGRSRERVRQIALEAISKLRAKVNP